MRFQGCSNVVQYFMWRWELVVIRIKHQWLTWMVVIQLKIMILLKFTISCYTYFVGKKKGQNFVYQLYFIILYQVPCSVAWNLFIFYFKYCFVSFVMYFLFPGFDVFWKRHIEYPDFSYLFKSHDIIGSPLDLLIFPHQLKS